MNNDWHEKDGLPPVGTECEYIIGEHRGRNNPCTFVGLNSRGDIVIEDCNGEYKAYNSYQIKFRPLYTETDKLVEQMKRDLSGEWGVSLQRANAICSHLIEKGYRKTKPMSEQEFMEHCIGICGYGDARLYRAGCRFIDQGDNDE